MTTTTTTTGSAVPSVSRVGYVVAAVVFLVAAVGSAVLVVAGVVAAGASLGRFDTVEAGRTPTTFELPAGQYVAFIEADDDLVGSLTPFSFHMSRGSGPPAPGDPQLVREAPARRRSIDIAGHRYQDIGAFELRGGTYSVSALGPQGTRARFGRLSLRRPLMLMLGGSAVWHLGAVMAGMLVVITASRRSRARRPIAAGHQLPPPPVLPAPPSAPSPPVSPGP